MIDKTIVFLAGALSQPRCIKRVASFKDNGFHCIVYGYDRCKYDVNTYPPGVAVINLGTLKDNEYIGKAIKIFRDISKVYNKEKSNHTLFYAFGFFQALYLKLLGARYIYEISDVLYAYPKFRYLLGTLKSIDKYLIRKSVATVMTSGGFYTFYGIKESKVFVVPNKVSPSLNRPVASHKIPISNQLSFGFVGSLRYQTILNFAEVVGEQFPQYEFHFWGGLNGEMKAKVEQLSGRYRNIYNHGVFRSPTDLPIIYDSFDITVSCYQVFSLNERIAEPNKLYESLFFNKPIVVSDGIYLSSRVKELGCGYCIDAGNKKSISDFIKSLDVEMVSELTKKISLIDEKEIVNNQAELNDFIFSSFE